MFHFCSPCRKFLASSLSAVRVNQTTSTLSTISVSYEHDFSWPMTSTFAVTLMHVSPHLLSAQVLLDGKVRHRLVILLLGLCNRKPGVDFEGLSALMIGIGLDERIIDPLFFEPGEEKMP